MTLLHKLFYDKLLRFYFYVPRLIKKFAAFMESEAYSENNLNPIESHPHTYTPKWFVLLYFCMHLTFPTCVLHAPLISSLIYGKNMK